MPRIIRLAILSAAAAVALQFVPGAAAGDAPATRPSGLDRDRKNLLNIAQAIAIYAAEHHGERPTTLGQTLPYIEAWTDRTASSGPKGSAAEHASLFLSSQDVATKVVPNQPTGEWIDQNTSYVYLADATTPVPKADWNSTAIVHAKLDQGYSVVTPDGGHVDVIPIAMLDGHVDAVPKAQTEALIAASKKAFAPQR